MGVGIRLKAALRDRNMTIKQLSEKSGISTNTLYSITKRDSENVDPVILNQISSTLKMDPGFLKGEEIVRFCPLRSSAGLPPIPCQSDCAWFIFPEGYNEGCCAIACLATSAHHASGYIEGIMGEVSHATP